MVQMPMHTAVRDHAHDMRGAAGILHLGHKFLQRVVVEIGPVFDRQINLAQIHRHNTTRTDVGVPDLGVAHLPTGQTRVGAVGDQRGVGAVGHQAVHRGRVRQSRGIRHLRGTNPPTVQNGQNNRLGSGHRVPHKS